MNRGLTWHLEIIDWDGIRNKKFGGDLICNTTVECFFTLADVWSFLGCRLKKERCGYAGLRGNKEYRLTRM